MGPRNTSLPWRQARCHASDSFPNGPSVHVIENVRDVEEAEYLALLVPFFPKLIPRRVHEDLRPHGRGYTHGYNHG